MRSLVELPKAHLHVHLEAAIRWPTVHELAALHGVAVEPVTHFGGFEEFAEHGAVIRDCLRHAADFRRVAREFCADEAAQGTRYAELTFTAAAHGERLGDAEMPLEAVIDAGEMRGAESIRAAIGPGRGERLRHGIRVLEDEALVAEVRSRGLALEVCPFSNVALGFATSLADHPLPGLVEAGLSVTLSTDIPAALGITLSEEFGRVRDAFGYDDAALAAFNLAAIEASFAPEATKARLRSATESWLRES